MNQAILGSLLHLQLLIWDTPQSFQIIIELWYLYRILVYCTTYLVVVHNLFYTQNFDFKEISSAESTTNWLCIQNLNQKKICAGLGFKR